MTHLGQRLSALIDDELDGEGRDRVLVHLAGCEPCRAEAVALRALKRRMNALGETEADAALTGRLMGLAGLSAGLDGRGGVPLTPWSAAALSAGPAGRTGWPDRPAWFVFGGAVSVFLAGLGTAAFMAGGSPQAPEPEPRITPAVDVFVLQHDMLTGEEPAGTRSNPGARPARSGGGEPSVGDLLGQPGHSIGQHSMGRHSMGQHSIGRHTVGAASGGQPAAGQHSVSPQSTLHGP